MKRISFAVCFLVAVLLVGQAHGFSVEGAVSWFRDQPLVVKVETRGVLVTCCIKIYVSRGWYSLKQWEKESLFASWVNVWKRTGGNTIEVFDVNNPQGKAIAASYPVVGGAVFE